MKGNVSRVNQIPWQAIEAGATPWGTGVTPEGIDQNPLYYEFAFSVTRPRTPTRAQPAEHVPNTPPLHYVPAEYAPVPAEGAPARPVPRGGHHERDVRYFPSPHRSAIGRLRASSISRPR